jgi:superfamily I DNA and/or RNA helicase
LSDNIRKNLDNLKDKLLDLGKRNQMLYLKPKAKTLITIQHPEWRQILTNILDGQNLKLVRKIDLLSPKEIDQLYEEEKVKKTSSEENIFSDEDINLTKVNIPLALVLDKLDDDQIVSSSNDYELMSRATRIKTRARSLSEDSGVDALFLVLTVISWKESPDSDEYFQAPLLMCPTTLVKEKNYGYTFNPAEDEMVVNPALKIHLEKTFSLILPELKEDTTKGGFLVDEFLEETRKVISKEGFKIEDEAYVGIFAFSKIAMYNDIKNNFESLLLDRYVSAISGGPFNISINENSVENIEKNLDIMSTSKTNMIVVDADSSQLKAIELAKAGESFVIQGPPGTGKSQTITNMIAELISNGKKILFVSEKLAALNVVHSNLSKVNLDEFCLILHRTKTKKETIIADLYKSLAADATLANNIDSRLTLREQLRQDLTEYATLMHEEQPKIKSSIYQLLSRYYSFDQSIPHIELIDIQKVDLDQLESNVMYIKEHLRFTQYFGDKINTYPLTGIRDSISYDHPFMISSAWKEYSDEITSISETLNNLFDTPIDKFITIKDLSKLSTLMKFDYDEEKISSIEPNEAWFDVLNLKNKIAQIKRLIQITKDIETFTQTYNDLIINPNQIDSNLISEIIMYKRDLFWFLKPKFYSLKSNLKSSFNGFPPYKLLMTALESLKTYQTNLSLKSKLILDLADIIDILVDDRIEDLQNTELKLESFYQLLDKLNKINDWIKKLDHSTFEIDANPSNFIAKFELLFSLQKNLPGLLDRYKLSSSTFDQTKKDFSSINLRNFNEQILDISDTIPDYLQWLNYQKNFFLIESNKLIPFIKFLDQEEKASNFQDIYRKSFFYSWATSLIRKNRIVSGFVKEEHEEKIKQFVKLDNEIITHNKYRIRENVYRNKPFLEADDNLQYSEQSILKREFVKKRNKLSIRKLFLAIPNLIKEIKPVIMMSPITVANYLKFGDFKFDVLIFDEASQIFPYDAIGCLARGKQVIVAGDRYQLPPTNFFLTSDDENDDNGDDADDFEKTSSTDFESILDLAESKLRKVSLMWHYRSRNESLIAFSNQEIYDNRLITFPSRNDRIPNDGVEYHYVEKGVYDRGKSKTNRLEADRIIDLIIKHIREHPERSLGVVTVNSNQQELLDSLLFKKINGLKNLENFIYGETNPKEPFFIKNIESVQGDERDTIIFGIGYGKDSDGKFSMNFGPINKAGGERRLNVAISRAKVNIKIVSSIHGSDFRLSEETPRGVKLLAEYLDFAEKGNSALRKIVKHNTQVSESGFEEEVARVLENNGYMIEKQVGVSSFRIDLAIRHPDRPKVYALGIECDGASYHSGKIARDRDRLRQMVLERLGWKIYRIWSTDWFKNREKAVKNLLQAVEFSIHNFDKPIAEKVEEPKVEVVSEQETIVFRQDLKHSVYHKADRDLIDLNRQYKYVRENSFSTGFIKIFNTILDIESPVHISRLYQLFLPYYEREKVTSFVTGQLQRQLSYLLSTGKIKCKQEKNHFLSDFNNFVFRVDYENKRQVDEVHDLELLDGFKKALKHYKIMTKESLAVHILEALNYKGFNNDLIQYLTEKIEKFVELGELLDEGLSIKVNEKAKSIES